ncbi:MAG: hypothetical protein R3F61_36545 [Myxococcota bacterium]
MTGLMVVQALHVLAGVIWAGGQVVMGVAVLPALLGMPPREARTLLDALGARVGPLMALSGMAVMVLGIVRGTVYGPVRSLTVLLETPYGWTFSAALALAVVGAVHGSRSEARLAGLFDGERFHPSAGRRLFADAAFVVSLVVGLVGCMVAMHFGL